MLRLTHQADGWRQSPSGLWYHPSVCQGMAAHSLARCPECDREFFARNHLVKSGAQPMCSRSCKSRRHVRERGAPQLVEHRVRRGAVPHNYKGRVSHSAGYVVVTGGNQRQLEHRKVVENFLGRKLRRDEVIHHVNGDKADNRIENLRLMTQSEHMREHWSDPEFRAGWRTRKAS